MEIRTYPSRNNFFNVAISEICDEVFKFRRPSETIMVVCIAPWSVRDVVSASWLKYWNKTRVLIVSDTRFFPLAKYYQLGNEELIDICHTSEILSVMDDFLWSGKLCGEKNMESITHLTDIEYFSLKSALDGISVDNQALTMGLSRKTVFGYRASSARKLNVRKLSHLLSPKILNLSKSVVKFDREGRVTDSAF